jgi:maltose alpha-D-glucosyltransferase/alpha-amylase
MKRMIALRRQNRVFGRGKLEFLVPANRKILPYIRRDHDDVVLCVANLSRTIQPVELDLSAFDGYTPIEMLGQTEFPRISKQPYVLTIGAYGFCWFSLRLNPVSITARVARPEPAAVEQSDALFVGAAWDTLLQGSVRALIERDLLPEFVKRQRWFRGKAREVRRMRFVDWGNIRVRPLPIFATVVEVQYASVGGSQGDDDREHYFLPLAMSSGPEADEILQRYPNTVLGRISGARKGIVHDATIDAQAGTALLDLIARDEQVALRRGALRGWRAEAFAELRGDAPLDATTASGEQSNSMIGFGERLLLKVFRQVAPGPNPDVEITRELTGRPHPAVRVPRIAGGLAYQPHGEPATDMAMLQQRIGGQGDGWRHAVSELGRFFERADLHGSPSDETLAATALPWLTLARAPLTREALDLAGVYLENASTLGRRTAEMHLALADSREIAFAPEPMTTTDRQALATAMQDNARRALDQLTDASGTLPEGLGSRAKELAAARERVRQAFEPVATTSSPVSQIRVHGDYHLGQVIWAENDYYIVDFEGEPARTLAERRRKQLAVKDVAGMLRSFSYAAYAGLSAYTVTRPDQLTRIETWARCWQAWASAAFLRTYFDVAGRGVFMPAELAESERLLQAFVLDKAFYELRYELNSRPDWVRVPLWNILRLLNRTAAVLS